MTMEETWGRIFTNAHKREIASTFSIPLEEARYVNGCGGQTKCPTKPP